MFDNVRKFGRFHAISVAEKYLGEHNGEDDCFLRGFCDVGLDDSEERRPEREAITTFTE